MQVISLSEELRDQADLDGPAPSASLLETEVFVEAFEDGSLGLHYLARAADEVAQTFSVSPRFVAARWYPCLRGVRSSSGRSPSRRGRSARPGWMPPYPRSTPRWRC